MMRRRSSHPAENGPTLLDLWKAQARIENSRARENWDKLNPEEAWEIIGDAEIIREPEIKPDSEKKIARKQRDAQIKAWADAGMSTKEICARTGLGNSTVLGVVGVRNLREDKDARKQRDDQIKAWADGRCCPDKKQKAYPFCSDSSVFLQNIVEKKSVTTRC